MKTKKTPYGEDCIAVDHESRFGELITSQAHGSWQREVVRNLCDQGYIVGYLATGLLKGNARKYNSHYARSLENLMRRVTESVHMNSPYNIVSGSVGPKGAFGYYLSE